MRLSADRAIELLLCLLALAIPLYVVGFEVRGFDLNVAAVLLALLGPVLIVRGRFLKKNLLLLSFWLGWILLTVAWRYEPMDYVLSMGALFVVTVPLTASWGRIDEGRLFRYFVAGLVISLAFAGYDFCAAIFGLSPLEDVASVGLLSHSRTGEVGGFRRVKALMMEPAHYAIYLAFAYALVDGAGPRFFRERALVLLRVTIVIALVGTLSLAGMFLWGIAVLSRGALLALRLSGNLKRWSLGRLISVGILSGLIFLGARYSEAPQIAENYANRIDRTMASLVEDHLVGSEGSRANAIPVMLDYWDNGPQQLLVGEGYANFEMWLMREYGHLGRWSSYARGEVNNTFAVVGISTGAPGLLLFLLFVLVAAFTSPRKLPVHMTLLWLASNFASGMLIGYLIWSLALVAILLSGAFTEGRPLSNPPLEMA